MDLQAYKLYLIDNEIRPNTIKNYLNTLQQLDQYLNARELELNKENLIAFKEHLKVHEYETGKRYKTNTINQKIVSINIYLNWLERHELSLKLLKAQIKEHRESINDKEFKSLMRHATSEEMRLLMLTIANTGLRITEICNLCASDLETSIVQIENKGKQRVIAIPPFLKKQLKKYVVECGIQDEIFYKKQATYRENLKVIAGKAKVKKEKVYPHSFRHYFAKQFLTNGGDSTDLQQMLGHESINTTTIYTKLSTQELGEKFRKIRNM
ncbi:MAG TPA: integrase [Enterococcus sp.]|nr:integrase [Enterococcus sp.]